MEHSSLDSQEREGTFQNTKKQLSSDSLCNRKKGEDRTFLIVFREYA